MIDVSLIKILMRLLPAPEAISCCLGGLNEDIKVRWSRVFELISITRVKLVTLRVLLLIKLERRAVLVETCARLEDNLTGRVTPRLRINAIIIDKSVVKGLTSCTMLLLCRLSDRILLLK